MYRQCDLVNGLDGRLIRATIKEAQAQEGNKVTVPHQTGHWLIIRTHGYSPNPLETVTLPKNFDKKVIKNNS